MDEIEFAQTYNEAVSVVDSEPRKAALLTLLLVNALREMIEEMQVEEDE